MPSVNSDLLRPSLSDPAAVAAAPYTQQTSALVAFFGGPFAMAILLAIDARRLGRLRKDLIWALLIAGAFVGWLVFSRKTPAGVGLMMQVVHEFGRRGPVIIERLIALLGFALGTWLHRKQQRSAVLFGLERPNGLVMGIALIALGYVLGEAAIAVVD
jgi:hypothetical protein